MTKPEPSGKIDGAAAEWVAKLDGGQISGEEMAALEAWLAGDPRRLGAFARAQAVAAHFDRARALGPNFDADAFLPPPEVPVGHSRRKVLWLGGGAVAAAAAAGPILIAASKIGGDRFHTAQGEIRVEPLPDGSVVTLNTSTWIAVKFSDDRRDIRLLSGEALFDVAKDPNRPFLVQAGAVTIRAVGTSFSVRCTAETPETPVQVLVREGVVEVEQTGVPTATQQAATQQAAPERLTANMKATADTAARISTARMTPEDVKAHLSWQEGMIAFNGATLAEAAAEFARYSDYRITISDPAVANRTVTGLFSAYNPSGFAVAVGTSLDLRVTTGQHGATIAR